MKLPSISCQSQKPGDHDTPLPLTLTVAQSVSELPESYLPSARLTLVCLMPRLQPLTLAPAPPLGSCTAASAVSRLLLLPLRAYFPRGQPRRLLKANLIT